MIVRLTACMGMTFLLCTTVPASVPAAGSTIQPVSPAALPASPAGAVTPFGPPAAILAGTAPASGGATQPAAVRPQPRPRTTAHRRFRHIRHHVKASPAVPIGEIRSQIAQTVGLLNTMDENVRNQLTENRADAARLTAAMENQANQLSLVDKRVDGIDQRQAAETRSRRQDAALLQTHIAEQGARIDSVEQRLATVAAARADASLYVAGGLAGLGLLLGIVAMIVSYRQRLAAVAEAEHHADRLYRTYRAEFESLAQVARDLEARLPKTSLPPPTPSLHLYPESEPVGVRA